MVDSEKTTEQSPTPQLSHQEWVREEVERLGATAITPKVGSSLVSTVSSELDSPGSLAQLK